MTEGQAIDSGFRAMLSDKVAVAIVRLSAGTFAHCHQDKAPAEFPAGAVVHLIVPAHWGVSPVTTPALLFRYDGEAA